MPRLSKELQTKLEAIHLEINRDETLKAIIYEFMDKMIEGGKNRTYIINQVFTSLLEIKKQVNKFRELD